MSQENVEVVRSLYEAFNRRDYATAVEYLHPGVEVYPAVVGVDPAGAGSTARWIGREGVRQTLEDLGATWQTVTVEFEEVAEATGGRVLAVEHWRTRGRDGIEIVTTITDVYAFRDGLIVRVDGFRDKTEALEAAGLRE
jgi:ketosteroid isomerase-like protein